MDRVDALRLAIRCARDSMPPLRLAILDDVAAHPGSLMRDVRRRLAKPRTTIDRQLQSLHMLGVLCCDEEEVAAPNGNAVTWRYRLADDIQPNVLRAPDLSPPYVCVSRKRAAASSDISGVVNPRPFDPSRAFAEEEDPMTLRVRARAQGARLLPHFDALSRSVGVPPFISLPLG